MQNCNSFFSELTVMNTTISTHENQAYQTLTIPQPPTERFDNGSSANLEEIITYEQVGQSTDVHSSSDMNNVSTGLNEN